MLRASFFLAAFLLWRGTTLGQAYPIFNGTVNTCVGAFLDSGGEGAVGYSNNENFTYTICPDTPNDAVSLTFLTFNLSGAGGAPMDQMTIYDGSSTAATTLGSYAGTSLQGVTVNASPLNSTGCLTIVFRSNDTGVGVFAASINCYTPCQRPVAAATMSQADPVKICVGESITFNSSTSSAAPGFNIASRQWDFGDGTVVNNAPVSVSHTYTQAGGFKAQLYLVDNNGCASANRTDLLVMVGTEPDFIGTTGDLLGCTGETLCLEGVVNATTWTEIPGPDLGGGVFLPDDVGSCFESEIIFSQFAPGQTLTNVNDMLSVCMNMEHSFMGDLVLNLISPTGQSVTLHQQGGGATFLGVPVDNDATPNVQGECWNYCFAPNATNGTWVDNAAATLPSGTYESVENMNGLVGSQLNGIWRLQICDLWGSDNGFQCSWDIDFDPDLYPDLLEFTPIYGQGCDSSYWSGPSITSTSGDCDESCVTPAAPGTYAYVYTVKDDFGCTYDTTLNVTIVAPPVVNAGADVTTCGTPVQLGATMTTPGLPGACNYSLRLIDTFGDGWDGGAQVTVTMDGISNTYALGDPPGNQMDINVPVLQGDVITLTFQAGSLWNGENRYVLRDAAGTVVFNSGLGPATGVGWSGTASCPPEPFTFTWTPTAGLSNANIANPIANVAGTTVYCVTALQPSHPNCTATDCVTITVDTGVDPGTNGSITVCENGAAFDLFPLLGGTPTAGGSWSAPGGVAHSGNFTPGADTPGVYTYTVLGSAACGGTPETATITVAVSPLADAGTNGTLTICSTSGAQDLSTALGGTADAGGTWSGPSPVNGSVFDPGTMNAGTYTYTVNGIAPCPSATATVSVVVNTPPNNIVDGFLTLCSSDAAVSLFAQLGGTPDAGGTWSGPSAVAGGMIDPATMSAGVYTYTVAGTTPCPDESATVTVTINTPQDAGTDGSITLCYSDAATSLFAQLGGTPDAGGTWSGPSAVVGGMIDPATMNAGVYTYTVAGTAPCPDETATVTVTINTPPDAGTDGAITLCSSNAATSLFAQLGGTPDAGGTWSGPSAVVGGMIDPATMSAGVYSYTVAGTAPCPDESATVTVTINTPPDAGTDGAITLCSSDAATSLFAQLGGTPDAGGTWSGSSAVVGGMIDPATMNAGVYTYTVAGTAPCPDESATVAVTINTPPDAGTDGALALCATSPSTSLITALGGTPDPGGTWTGPSGIVGGLFDPAIMVPGDYTYTVLGAAPCVTASAIITVNVVTDPDPGTPGSLTVCTSAYTLDLFAELGGTPDAGGTWSGPSILDNGLFDPATMSAGIYTYTITVPPPCTSVNSTVTVTTVQPPDAGNDGSLTLCISSPATALITSLGGSPDAGGTWSGPSAVSGGSFNPATMSVGTYTYTVAGTSPCPADVASVDVNVVAAPDAGTPGTTTVCSTDAAFDLFNELNGTPDAGGTWTGPSAITGGLFNPSTMLPGVYTYTIAVPPPCVNATSTVTVNMVQPPHAGEDGSLTLCISSPATALIASLGGSPDAGGTWSGPSTVTGGSFNPATMSVGTYTYTVAGTSPCPADVATVDVNVVAAPDAGTPGTVTVCSTDAAFDLFNELNSTPDAGGIWTGPSAIQGGQFDPATMLAGIYTYTIAVPPPCVNATSTVTVNMVQPPDAGNDGSLTICISSPATALITSLGGSPDAGGTWNGPSTVIGGSFNPATMSVGTYTYTVAGTSPCPADVATVDVNVVAAPDAGTPGAITVCSTDAAFDLFNEFNGTPDAGGTWTGPSAIPGGQFDPATMAAGIYTYTISVPPPCVNASSTVTVNMVQPPDAGNDGSLTLCISSPATALITSLGGSPDAGGTWSGPSAVSGGTFNPATMSVGTYTYTVAGTSPCPADVAAVMVDVVAAPDAGTPGVIALCTTDAALELYNALGGTPDAGGVWSGPSVLDNGMFDPATMQAGLYTYTITVPPPCVNASSTVTITVATPPDAGLDGGLTLCATSPPEALFNGLTGTPEIGGIWSGPSTLNAGLFNPATMSMGVYTYTVNGTTPCPSASANVEVNVVDNPDPGGPGFITLCSTDPAVDMFTWIEGSPDAGGTWTGPNNANADALFDPAIDLPGVYTYTLNVPPPCTSANTTVTVDVITPPNAGDDGAITLCITSGGTPLFPVLLGTPDAGGTWAGPGGASFNGTFDPNTNTPSTYTYTVPGTTPCPADMSTVLVNVVTDPDPGIDGILTLCSSDAAASLFGSLNGTPDIGGTWTAPNGQLFNGNFDPSIDVAGVYTYTIEAPPPCSNVSATVTVSIVQPPNAGVDGALVACATGASVELFTVLQGGPENGGSWTGPSGEAFSGMFDPASDLPGTYAYLVTGTSPCPNDVASVQVSITEEPFAGTDAILNLCITGDAVDIFPSLGGADLGGTWSSPDGSAFTGVFTPGTSAPGDYVYDVNGTAPCPNASATITVTQLSDPDAGEDGSITLCSSNAPIALFDLLGGTPDPGGTWFNLNGDELGDTFDPSTQDAGTFTYLLTVPAPCSNDTSLVVVTVVQASSAGEDATTASCANGTAIDLFATLNGAPDAGGTWTGPSALVDGTFIPGTNTVGTYTYTVEGSAPCPDVSASVTVAVEPLPDAGEDGSTTVCPEAPPVTLFSLLGGTPDPNGTWTSPDGTSNNGTFDPATDIAGAYTYTVAGTLCPDDLATSTVTIYAVPEPNAGPDAITCGLKYMLSATGEWASGSWSGPPGVEFGDADSPETEVTVPGGAYFTFVWTTVTAEGCASSDEVTILFTKPLEGVATTMDAVCHGSCDGTASVEVTGGNIGTYFYIWSAGVAGNVPHAMGLCAGSYSVLVADTNGCNVNIPFTIGEPAPLVIDGVTATPETCPGSCDGTISVLDPEGVLFHVDGTQQASPTFTGLCAGPHSILMTDEDGCTATSAAVITSPPPVLAGFTYSPDTIFISDPAVMFLNTSSANAVSFSWNFGSIGTSSEENPVFTFPDREAAIYEICLTVQDANGCANELCAPLPIFDVLLVHVPNAFSPNGDGHNDEFLPIFNLPQVKDYQFMVFNRWGEQIFGTDQPGKPWDGGYSGVLSQVDVYVWKLTCKDALSGELIERVGHVTMVK